MRIRFPKILLLTTIACAFGAATLLLMPAPDQVGTTETTHILSSQVGHGPPPPSSQTFAVSARTPVEPTAAPAPPACKPQKKRQLPTLPATVWGEEKSPACQAFHQWFESWNTAEKTQRETLLADGMQLASARRTALRTLIAQDPQSALRHAVPAAVRSKLPDALLPLLEEQISTRGNNLRFAAQGPSQHDSPHHAHQHPKGALASEHPPCACRCANTCQYHRIVEFDDGRRFEAYTYGSEVHQPTRYNIPLRGIIVDDRFALAENPAPAIKAKAPIPSHQLAGESGTGGTGTANGSAWTTGPKKLLILRVDFPNRTGTPVDATSLLDLINNQCAPFFEKVSYGKTTVTLDAGDVSSVYRLSHSNTYTNLGLLGANDLANDAHAKAVAAGYSLDDYDRVLIIFPTLSAYAWTGLGLVGGDTTWFNGAPTRQPVVHELGHNYGLPHANKWAVSGNDPVDPAGTSLEYGDVFDNMGAGSYRTTTSVTDHYNPSFLHRLGWLPSTAVTEAVSSGTFRIHRFDNQNADLGTPLALRVNRDAGRNYWISYRKAPGGDISDGAYILWDYDDGRASDLIDIDTPSSDATDASLNVGETFVDSEAGLTFTVTDAGGSSPSEWIDVQVSFAPRLRFELFVRETEESIGTLTLNVLRENNATGTVSVDYDTGNDTATCPADFAHSTGTLTWPDGDDSPRTISIPIVNDSTPEGLETFSLTLSNPTGGVVILNKDNVDVTIVEPGAVDGNFFHEFVDSSILSLESQPDGKNLLGGWFTSIGNYPPLDRSGIARFNEDGSLDTDFMNFAGAGVSQTLENGEYFADPVWEITLQNDGKILLGGEFSTVNGSSKPYLARLEQDGSLDTAFPAAGAPNGNIRSIVVQPDGCILIGGSFTSIGGVARKKLARLLPDGSLDTTFVPGGYNTASSNTQIDAIALHPDGNIIIGGNFYLSTSPYTGGILRLDSTGAIDPTFNIGNKGTNYSGAIYFVHTLSLLPDGKILVGGNFPRYNGASACRIVRLHPDGTRDTSFYTSTGANDRVYTLAPQPDGRIIMGGKFTSVQGIARDRVARLLPGGTIDTNFVPVIAGNPIPELTYEILLTAENRALVSLNPMDLNDFTPLEQLYTGIPAPTGTVSFANGPQFGGIEGVTMEITVERVGGSFGAASVNYGALTGAGTAVEGSDFTLPGGTLTWADGEDGPRTISLPLTQDGDPEGAEIFTLQLGTPIGTFLDSPSVSTVTISDATPIQSWRLAHFGTPDNGGTAANSSDHDGDRLVNIIEYALGAVPTDASPPEGASAAPTALRGSTGVETGRLVLTFQRPTDAPADLIYLVEAAASVDGPWTPLVSKTGTAAWTIHAPGADVTEQNLGDGRTHVRAADSQTMDASTRRFLRLRVESF